METQLSIFTPELNKFHNTIDLPESELKVRQLKVGSQNSIVYTVFKIRPDRLLTPVEVWEHLILIHRIAPNTPLTSIRRAMTNLTALGYLIKTDEKRPGEYGELNYCWKLA